MSPPDPLKPDPSKRWYAVRVMPRHEHSVQQLIEYKGYETFVPWRVAMRRWSDRQKRIEEPLFPGYVFCHLAAPEGTRPAQSAPVLTTPGVIRFIGAGAAPLPIEDHEMRSLRAVVDSDLSKRPWPFLREGQRIEVVCGPLRGTFGLLASAVEEDYLVVSLTLLQRSLGVRVRRDWIRPV